MSIGRGKNPNSHHNKPKLGTIKKWVCLTPEQWEFVQSFGNGYSEGVRNLVQQVQETMESKNNG